MSTATKILLQGLVLGTLVCVGLCGHPQAFGGAPLQSTSIRSGCGPDSQCVVVRRTLSADSTQSTDDRPVLVGVLPSTLFVSPSAYRLVPGYDSLESSISSHLVIAGPRARSPPSSRQL